MLSLTGTLGILVASALGVGSPATDQAASLAEEPSETIIYGQRPAALTRRVSYQDLDLRTKAGERQLLRRVSAAVVRGCPSDSVLEKHHCRNLALRRVRPQVKQAVHNARNMVGFVRLTTMFITIPESE
ncbi:UrcA family protein [uncultured Sphingomonas sp.]|uniref:UrcA family protein n=1 Tax=uncultured Sphingomonas sp. TaxID=158754 RepID=UPI0025CD5253|nr:UrcA family protein [uncultured Sphingomonas sp.]